MDPLLSVVIPVYNAANYLEECLFSIIDQKYKNIEIICVDDGSTDNSITILEKWKKKDNRINVIHQENNGPSSARNKGLEYAHGDYITFVDADDFVKNEIYLSSISEIQKNNLDVYSFAIESYPGGSVRRSSFPTGIIIDYKQLFASNNRIQSENALCFSVRFVFRSSIIKENKIRFYEDIHFGEDMLFNTDVICHSRRIMVTNDSFYYYRKNNTSAMSLPYKQKLKDSLVKAYDKKIEQIEKYDIDKQGFYRNDISEYYIKVFLPLLISNEYHKPNYKINKTAIKDILSLKMIKNSFKNIGLRNIYSSKNEYIFYLMQKFRIYQIVFYIYNKQIKK